MAAELDLLPGDAPCGFVAFAADGTVVGANATLRELLGYVPGALPGRLAGLLTVGSRLFHQNYVVPLLALHGRADEIALTLRRADGAELPVLANLVRVDREGAPRTEAVLMPMHRRHAFERDLREARRAAEAANQAKSVFLSMMSHELRTPLNAIIGFTQQVRKNPGGAIAPRELHYLERVEHNGRGLLALVNDVLDLSRIEAARVTVSHEPTDVGALVRDVVAQLDAHPRAAGVSLGTVLPARLVPLSTDPMRLRQVLVNLVGNAVKFTERGAVTVAVCACPDSGAVRALEVRDTGIGIAPDRLEAIFRPFEQAEADTSRRFGGTGLGLPIARGLCELLGATLSVESAVGMGTTFTVAFGG